jgi:hypothetical protein
LIQALNQLPAAGDTSKIQKLPIEARNIRTASSILDRNRIVTLFVPETVEGNKPR